MQQLYLTGRDASALASRLFLALNVPPAGFRLLPFTIGGEVRGEALHLLLPPMPPMHNDVPVRIRMGDHAWTTVPQVLDGIAAPCLTSLTQVRTFLWVDSVTGEMLASPVFTAALRDCLLRQHPVVVVAQEDAMAALKELTPIANQLWMPVPEDAAGQEALLEELITEATLRFDF